MLSHQKKQKTISMRLAKIWKQLQYMPIRYGYSNLKNVFVSYQPDSLRDFNAHQEFWRLAIAFTNGNIKNNGGDITRLWGFLLNCKQINQENIKGDFAELGVWRGNTAAILAFFAKEKNRRVFLFDTYEGFDKKDIKGVDSNRKLGDFNDTSIEMVKNVIGEDAGACSFVKGYFPDSVNDEHRNRKYAIVSLDCDLYEPMKAGLDFFYPRMSTGGIFFLHDYSSFHWEGAKKAIDEFCHEHKEFIVLMPDKSGSAFFRKSK